MAHAAGPASPTAVTPQEAEKELQLESPLATSYLSQRKASDMHTPHEKPKLMRFRSLVDGADPCSSEDHHVAKRVRSVTPHDASAQRPPASPIAEPVVGLEELSFPPSRDELRNFIDIAPEDLPRVFKRADQDRVFCSRNVSLCDIRHFGCVLLA